MNQYEPTPNTRLRLLLDRIGGRLIKQIGPGEEESWHLFAGRKSYYAETLGDVESIAEHLWHESIKNN